MHRIIDQLIICSRTITAINWQQYLETGILIYELLLVLSIINYLFFI